MSTATAPPESKSAADIRRELEELNRKLDERDARILAIHSGMKNERGERVGITPEDAEDLRRLEEETKHLGAVKGALLLEHQEMAHKEARYQRQNERLSNVTPYSMEGGTLRAETGPDGTKSVSQLPA